MPIGETFLSASVQLLFDKVISELGKLYGVEDEAAKLGKTLMRLRATLRDAEQQQELGERESFTLWLQELKSAACDAEDVVDEFDYEDLRRQVQRDAGGGLNPSSSPSTSRKRKVREFFSHRLDIIRRWLRRRKDPFHHEMACRIDEIRRRLDDIAKDKQDFVAGGMWDFRVKQPEFKRGMKETSSLLVNPDVFGRIKERSRLIQLLLGTAGDGSVSPSTSVVHPKSFSVLSIVGMGGIGKTTLSQWVYDSEEVREYFHARLWVCVSMDFDLKRVTKQILEHVVDPQCGLQSIDNLNVLQKILVERLQGKLFLLVLDDVWEEDHTKWWEFFAPLTHAERGSKVLITTRNVNVANTVQSVKVELEGLPFDDCWSIFRKHAFTDATSVECPILESIGKEIVKRFKGIPLAATTIGGLLRSQSKERKWRTILESELWELEKGGEGIFPALKLSYEYLPPHLKECFAYCSVFPKGYEFDILELVQLWMAQGCVLRLAMKPVEDVGRDNVDELFSRSLIQFVNGKYVLHDLLHDLGHLILQHDYYRMGCDLVQKVPEDAHFKRHLLSVVIALEKLYKFRSVRSLLIQPSQFTFKEESQVLHNLFGTMKCLRMLDLSYCGFETLPDSIGCLKHLRYLDLRKTPIKCLPESLCALYKLQTLKLDGCEQLNILPKGMRNLISLHYLEAKRELVSAVSGIGKLTNLQNLAVFCVSEANENKIGDLKNMKELRGKLCIQNLHLVETREDAIEATLKNKHYLEILEMEWADERDIDHIDNRLEESIIEGLQPPPHLKELIIKCYAGINFPSWLNKSSLCSLESIHLNRCINLNRLPPVGQLHSLRTLDITSCSHLNELPCLPTALRNLILKDLRFNSLPNSLQDLSLQQLVICQIPRLRELPLLPATLKELTVHDVGLNALPKFCLYSGMPSSTSTRRDDDECSDSRKASLSILKIHGCPYLKTLREGLLQHHLRHLRVLSIQDCNELVHWPEGEGFQATLCSLEEELSIERCPYLTALPEEIELSASLKKLVVKACPGVTSKSLFNQLCIIDSDDIYVEKQYPDLAHCSNEALQHIMTVDWLKIKYLQEFPQVPSPPVLVVHDREQTISWAFQNNYVARRVSLTIREERRRPCPVVNDGDSSKLLCTCLGGHPWTSCLRVLILDGIPDGEFLDEALLHHPLHLPSLEELQIWSCKEMMRLPTETLLCHLKALKMLVLADCPELTLSSLEEGIRSVPSLKVLYIYRCPKLLMPLLSPMGHYGSEDALSAPPPLPLPSPLPLLQRLTIDCAPLLTQLLTNDIHHGQTFNNGNGQFFRNHFTSLRVLRILLSPLTSLTTEEEEGLMTLASSLQCLAFVDCPNLQNLPIDLGSLLPNLKVLYIANCPEIQCLPNSGLPASLEVLCIVGCPTLSKRCCLQPCTASPAMQGVGNDGWHKMVHIPVIEIDKVFLQGSYSRFLEFKEKWDFIY